MQIKMGNEWKQQIKGKKCEFEYEGVKCSDLEPEKKIIGMARCKNLCRVHLRTVVKDNIRRFNKGEDIPRKLVFTKPLRTSDTFSRFGGELTEIERREEKDGN